MSMGYKKDIFAVFTYEFELLHKSRRKPCISSIPQELHIINTKCCISSATCCGISSTQSVVYHHCEKKCSLRLMIYTFGDEMHASRVMIYHCFRNG